MNGLKKLFENRHLSAVIFFLLWLGVLGGGIFLAGNVFESIPFFIIMYNMIFPIATAVGCFVFAKRHGIVYYLPVAMTSVSVLGFVFTELLKFAIPNVIAVTVITSFFGFGVGNVFYGGNSGGNNKKTKEKKYRSIVDD